MKTVSCFGSGHGKPGDAYYDAMQEVGRLLVQKEFAVATGGFSGTGMEAPAKGATDAGGKSIGYIAFYKRGNKYLSETIDSSRLFGQSVVKEIQFGVRLGKLLLSNGFIIAAGGGPGSMVELMTAINLNYKLWKDDPKPIAILRVNDSQPGWNNQMIEQLEQWGLVPEAVKPLIQIVSSPEAAVQWVTK